MFYFDSLPIAYATDSAVRLFVLMSWTMISTCFHPHPALSKRSLFLRAFRQISLFDKISWLISHSSNFLAVFWYLRIMVIKRAWVKYGLNGRIMIEVLNEKLVWSIANRVRNFSEEKFLFYSNILSEFVLKILILLTKFFKIFKYESLKVLNFLFL